MRIRGKANENAACVLAGLRDHATGTGMEFGHFRYKSSCIAKLEEVFFYGYGLGEAGMCERVFCVS
jgi:hypothetical protein